MTDDNSDTGGCLTVMEQRARLGFSPPLHIHHREDTALLVLEGRLTTRVGEVESTLAAGEFCWLPRNVPHSFRVASDEAHFLEFATPGGVEVFHNEASDPAPLTDLPPESNLDIGRLAGAAAHCEIDIVGPPMM